MSNELASDIEKGECDVIEFKLQPNADSKEYLKTAVAFANCQGGKILFGIDDKRNIIGIRTDVFKAIDEITNQVYDEITPQLPSNIFASTIDGKTILTLDVRPGVQRPYHLKRDGEEDGTFIRVNATTRLCSAETLADLRLQGAKKSFDMIEEIGKTISEEDAELLNLCRYASAYSGRTVSAVQLSNMGLLKITDNTIIPTRGYSLLTTNNYIQARIECAKFRGTNRDIFVSRRTFEGPIYRQVDDAVDFVKNSVEQYVDMSGTHRIETYEVPIEAVRELITNAVVHRSYTAYSSPVFVAVYSDRIEIVSPGTFPNGMKVSDIMNGYSHPRNIAIFSFFKLIGMTEGWGSGVRRAFDRCTEAGLDAPSISLSEESVVVTIFRRRARESCSQPGKTDGLRKRVLEFYNDNPSSTIPETAKYLGTSESTVSRCIKQLKDEGLLLRTGSRKNGSWNITGHSGTEGHHATAD